MHILLLGPPGSGKGTQAKLIAKRYSIPHISMGDELRKIAVKKTPAGSKIKKIMLKGALVPDHLTIDILKKRICKPDCRAGFILDGFPRDIKQAELLLKITHVDHAIYLDVPVPVLVKRLAVRRQCKSCEMIYGVKFSPGANCPKCGGHLFQRNDDRPVSIRNRIAIFKKSTIPVINFYKRMGRLRKINGNTSPEKIFMQVRKILH